MSPIDNGLESGAAETVDCECRDGQRNSAAEQNMSGNVASIWGSGADDISNYDGVDEGRVNFSCSQSRLRCNLLEVNAGVVHQLPTESSERCSLCSYDEDTYEIIDRQYSVICRMNVH